MNPKISGKIAKFFSQYPKIRLHRNEHLSFGEQQVPFIYFLVKGKVRMYSISQDGIETTLHIFRPASYVPIMVALSSAHTEYLYECIEDIVAFKAPTKDVVDYLKANQDVLFDLTTRFADAICGLLVRIQNQSSDSAREKIFHLLSYLAEKFGTPNGKDRLITLELSHEDIAQWTGIARETVTRHLAVLSEEGLISSHNKHFIIHKI